MPENLPAIPRMRDVLMSSSISPSPSGKNPAKISSIVFGMILVLGIFLRLITGSNVLFLFSLIGGFFVSFVIYWGMKKLPTQPAQIDLGVQATVRYQPVFSRLNSANFDSASEHAKAIIKGALQMSASQPEIFAIADESLGFYLDRFLHLAETKKVLGDERELRRNRDRARDSLSSAEDETIKANIESQISDIDGRIKRMVELENIAARLTGELAHLRSSCENALLGKVRVDSEQAVLQLRERLDREQRVAAELASMGI